MTLTKLKPARRSLLSDTFFPMGFDSLFSELVGENQQLTEKVFTPKAEITEKEDRFSIKVVFAGFDKDDIKIDVNDNQLTVSGENKVTSEKDEETYHLREIATGKFKRSFYLPDGVNMDEISAEFKNGMLMVEVPKKAKSKVKEITIK